MYSVSYREPSGSFGPAIMDYSVTINENGPPVSVVATLSPPAVAGRMSIQDWEAKKQLGHQMASSMNFCVGVNYLTIDKGLSQEVDLTTIIDSIQSVLNAADALDTLQYEGQDEGFSDALAVLKQALGSLRIQQSAITL